jgi:VWFA-related protein
MNGRAWIAVVAIVLAATGVLAQRIAETVQVTVIEVPVTVVGNDGKAMRGLTKEQFELYDEGKKVPVEYFEVLDMKVLDTANNKALPPAATRNFLLFFDLANSGPGTIKRAADAATTFIDAQMTLRDLGAVAIFTAEKGARLITSFTTDKDMLKTAVRTLGKPEYFQVADPLMISFKATVLPSEIPVGAEREPGETPSIDDRPQGASAQRAAANAAFNEHLDTIEREQQRTATIAQNTEQRNRLRVQLSELATIARVLDRLHGRKQIILLSEGFDARLVQGREDISASKATEENDQKLSGEVWHVNSDERYGNAGSARDINEMAALFRRSDVVLHAIDIKGLRGNTDSAAGEVGTRGKTNEGLFLLTEPTGGTVFQHTNDLKATFARMMEQQEVVYLLGFNAKSAGKPGKFHSLKVKTTAAGARVSHRAGYFEASDRMTNLEKTISLSEILMTDKPINDVGMSLAFTTLPGAFIEKARVPVVIELPGDKFLQGVDGGVLTANLFIYAFDKKNQVRDNLAQRIALDIIDQVETVRAGGIRYFGTLQLPPGDYAIKAVVRVEETGKIGFVRSDVHVPEFESAAVLPPVFLSDSANWVTLAGSPRGDLYPYPFNAGEQKYVPRSRPALKSGASQRLALFLYRVPSESLGVTPQLVSASGAAQTANVKLVGRTPADEQGSSKLLFDFTPEGLQPGDYELRFTVKPKEGIESVVTLPFRIL